MKNELRAPGPMKRAWCGAWLLALTLAACSGGDAQSARSHVRDAVAVAGPEPAARETEAFVSAEPPLLEAKEESDAHGTTGDATRLVYSHVSALVRNGSAVIRVSDVVSNDGTAPVPFTYTFPLPSDATVSELAYFSNGKRMKASAQGKAEAKAAFEQAKARGDSATLAENTGNSRFSVAMSPLAPGESRRVELEYVQGVESFGAERCFTFPAAHSERRGQPMLDFEVSIEGDFELSNVVSLNHPDARVVKLAAKSERVLLNRTASPLGQDLVVRWTERAEPLQLSLRSVAGRTPPSAGAAVTEPGFAQLDFAFNADTDAAQEPPRDFVFVVDTSLSMAGDALQNAKLLVQRSLEHLTLHDRLAMVEFDDQLASWGELLPATEQNKQRALGELLAKRASGLSNLEAAIDRAHELTIASKNAIVVLISDGQSTVGDRPDELLPAARASDFEGTRVFVALVNYPSRQPQLERVFPQATLRFLPGGDAGRQIAQSLAQLVAAPVLENVSVNIEGLTNDDRFGALPARLALGERIHVLGRTTGSVVTANVSATLHGRALHFTQSVGQSARDGDRVSVPREWARAKLSALEARDALGHDPAVRTEAVELAKQFGLVSAFTSLVASDSLSPDRVAPGDPELRIRAPRSTAAVTAVLPWGDEVHCAWQDSEQLWLGRFLVPREVSDGLYRVLVFTTDQGRTRRRGSLPLRVDSKAPRYQLHATRSDRSLDVTATPEGDVFDRNGDALRLDLVDVKSVSVELDGEVYRLVAAGAGNWQASLPRLPNGKHRLTLVATDYAQNSSRSALELSLTDGARDAQIADQSAEKPLAEAAPSARPPRATSAISEPLGDARCWFGKSARRASLRADGKLVELFDGFLRVDGRELTPCNGLPGTQPIALAAHDAGFLVAFRDGQRSLYRAGVFEPAPALSPEEAAALSPRTRPFSLSALSAGELPSAHVSALATFGEKLIVGTFDAGAFSIDSAQRIEPLPFAPRLINALLADGSKLWIASATGLFVQENGVMRDVPLSAAAAHVNDLTRARDGTLWLATSDGLLGLRDGEWRKLDERQGLPSRIVYAVTETADGALWAGSAGGVTRWTKDGARTFSVEDGSLPHRWVTALLPDTSDASSVWVGTYQGGVTHLGSSGARAVPGTQSLWLNPHGLVNIGDRVYAASMGDGLDSFDPAQPSRRASSLGPLPSRDVTAVQRFAGALWIGTRAGLLRIAR